MEKIFQLQKNGTTVRTEILAGLTTFMTMAYIIALNPNLLTNFDTGSALWNGVFLATCIASALAMFCMAFLANKPFALAPGMGLNSFFAVVASNIAALTGMSYVASFQAALVIILLEGIVFLILSVLNIREKIVEAIPLGVRLGIAPAIGLMLMNIGLGSNVGVYSETGGPFYVMRDFFGALTPSVAQTTMGSGYSTMVLTVVTMFIGLFVIVILAKKGVKAAVLLGMLVASIIYWIGDFVVLGVNPFASLATASFGQRFTVTPIQMITAFSAVINGGNLYQPYVVQSITDSDGNVIQSAQPTQVRQVISEATSAQVRSILGSVVMDGGTGKNAYQAGYRVAGVADPYSDQKALQATCHLYLSDLTDFSGFYERAKQW